MAMVPVALQLYTLRNETAKDFIGVLKKVAELGYAGVEFAGYGGLSAEELRKVLDDLGLKAAGTHVGIDLVEKDIDGIIDYNLTIGNTNIIVPWMPEDRRRSGDAWKTTAALLDGLGEKCRARGVTFGYHNHAFEFETFDGIYGMDILLGNSGPDNLKCELDLYWVKRAGLDPVEYLKKVGSRCNLIHMKDMADDAEKSFAEVGTGTMDIDGIAETGKALGVQWFIVEQDVCKRPALESVKISIDNLKAKGLA